MESKPPMRADNPFFGPEMKSKWAHLSRLGGDRVAILFEELRRRAGAIEGLAEELVFAGDQAGWTPTYSVEGKILFSAHVGAGSLAVMMRMDARERDRLLASKRVSAAARKALEVARNEGGEYSLRIAVRSRGDVTAAARLIVLRSRIPAK